MLPLHDQFSVGERKSFYNANETVIRSNVENCDANCEKTCGELFIIILIIPNPRPTYENILKTTFFFCIAMYERNNL